MFSFRQKVTDQAVYSRADRAARLGRLVFQVVLEGSVLQGISTRFQSVVAW
jgi:hypothetical protein